MTNIQAKKETAIPSARILTASAGAATVERTGNAEIMGVSAVRATSVTEAESASVHGAGGMAPENAESVHVVATIAGTEDQEHL
jgi:hypothetical protein